MKREYLIILGAYPPDTAATGIVVRGIIEEASKQEDVQFTVLCLTSDLCLASKPINSINVIRLLSRYGEYQKFLNSHRDSFRTSKWCVSSLPIRAISKLYYYWAKRKGPYDLQDHKANMFFAAEKLISTHKYDAIVTVSHPFSSQEIGYKIKKRHPRIRWIAYLLDSNANNAVEEGRLDQEIKILEKADKIIIGPFLVNDRHFKEYFSHKTYLLPHPITPISNDSYLPSKSEFAGGEYLCVYSGLFYEKIRNPSRLMELFRRLPGDFTLHLFSRGCNEIIDKYKTILGSRLALHGFVEQTELFQYLVGADFLINVGNSVSNAIPSKICEYISLGKPIINLYQIEEDLVNGYLTNYPMAINISVQKIFEDETIKAIVDFCKKFKGKRLSYDVATRNLINLRVENVSKEFMRIIG